MTSHQKNTLDPLETAVSTILILMGILVAVMLPATIFGSGTVAGIGGQHSEVCVQAGPGQGIAYGGSGEPGDGPIGLREGIRWFPAALNICDTAPSASTTALGLVEPLSGFVGALGFFGLMWALLRRARRIGIFDDSIPRSLRLLSAFILGWSLVAWLVTSLTRAVLLERMSAGKTHLFFLPANFPIVTILVGLGLLTLSRVMTQAVALREDVEATI